MARVNILDRFRPVGAPGPAGATGVPSDDARGPAWELAPVFAALRADVESADASVEAADEAAASARQAASIRAAEIRAQAILDAAEVRANAASRVTRAAARKDSTHRSRVERKAEALAHAADSQFTTATARVIAALATELEES
jgi:hypothetical protein